MTNNNPLHGFDSRPRDEATIDESEVFHILGNDRRRAIITSMAKRSREVNVSQLAMEIAQEEADEETTPQSLYKSVYVSLQQTHLPKLLEEEIIHYDDEEKTVRPGPRLDEVTLYVDDDDVWTNLLGISPLLVSLVGLVVVLASMYGVPFLRDVGVAVWAIAFLVLVAATNALAGLR